MIRGLVAGFISAIVFGLWVHRLPVIAPVRRHEIVPTDTVTQHAEAHAKSLLETIERESPWILSPSVKPSNNSSVQS